MEPATFLCQQCKARIRISSSDADPPLPGPGELPSALEESFMHLEDTLYEPRSEASPREWALCGARGPLHASRLVLMRWARRCTAFPGFLVSGLALVIKRSNHCIPPLIPGTADAAPRRMDESFVVLPSGNPRGLSPPTSRVAFHATLRALTNVLEVASGATGVDHPVCTDCTADVHRELDAQTSDLQAELAALEVALGRLEGAPAETPDPAADAAELAAAQQQVEAGR